MTNTWCYPVYSWIPTYWGQQGDQRYFQYPYYYGMNGLEGANFGHVDYQSQGSNLGVQQDFIQNKREEYESQESSFENVSESNVFRNQPSDLHQIISIDMAINAVREQVSGTVVKVELDRERPVWVYKVNIIGMDDTLDVIEIDVNTGDILGA